MLFFRFAGVSLLAVSIVLFGSLCFKDGVLLDVSAEL